MHIEILTEEQKQILPLINLFSKDFYLVGGTAIALYAAHRRSIDFDLFTRKGIKKNIIKKLIDKTEFIIQDNLYEDSEQLHLIINSVKLTFFHFPYDIKTPSNFYKQIKVPALLDLAAMKAYALGGRAKWKDYVDLYILLKDHFKLDEISEQAKKIFGGLFNEKLFREQLCYFKDIDYSEAIDYFEKDIPANIIKKYLKDIATAAF